MKELKNAAEQAKPDEAKRKTRTSTEVKARYNSKAYQRYAFTLRNIEDSELISEIESSRIDGMSDSALIRSILYDWKRKR